MLKKLWKWKSVWLVLFGTTFLLLACGPATSNIEVDVQITQINTGEYNQSQVIDQVFGADYYKSTPELFEPDGIYRVEVWVTAGFDACLFINGEYEGCSSYSSDDGNGYLVESNLVGDIEIIVCDPDVEPPQDTTNQIKPPESFRNEMDVSCPGKAG